MNRRDFLRGSAALLGAAGCRFPASYGRPDLRLGVISDLHVSTPESTAKFRRVLRYFRLRGVDAVVVAGDLTDYGLQSGFGYVKSAWDAEMSGSGIRPLFITGNHDFDGWWYGDITLDMHLKGYSEDDAISHVGMAECWEKTFGEPYAPVRMREVNGFRFVSAEWPGEGRCNDDESARFLETHAEELRGPRPFFFIRHAPLAETVANSGADDGSALRKALARFPNAVFLSGHTHWTLLDERSIWQGDFTALSIPSMEYTSVPKGYENGRDGLRRADSSAGMPMLPMRAEGREAQGYVLSVLNGEMVVERQDFEDDVEIAEPWVIPLGPQRPFATDRRVRDLPVPQFPDGAKVLLRTVNDVTRQGRWTIFWELDFPSATGSRAFDYEIRAVTETGKPHAVKRFLSPAFCRPARYEPCRQVFRFDGMDVPETGTYHFEVSPRNSFGRPGRPLLSPLLRSVPGKDISRGMNWRQV